MNVLKTENLTKYYGKSRGIINVSLSIKEGDFFGFIGPNGAGKSTTIRTLLGLISPTSGSVEIFGKELKTNKKEILSQIGYLPSEVVFYSGMRVKEVLRLSAKLRNADCQVEAKKLCERLELDPSRRIEELSFGNRKKVGIVCALQHNPRLCIFDEPTSGLDPLMQREFYSILNERNENGATVFLSTHVLSEVGRYCKNASVIREGKLLVTDSIMNIAHTGIKNVSLRAVSALPSSENIRNVKTEDDITSFLYSGDSASLIKLLSSVTFADVNITDPDLEDVFLHYYTKEEE